MNTVTDSKYSGLEEESAILDLFEQIKNPKHKKVRAFAIRMYAECTSEVQKRLCRDIYQAPEPVKYMYECIDKIRQCAVIIKQFVADGCHGMIFTGKNGDEVYPVKLDTRENWLTEGKEWDPEQEMIIQHDCANNWMKEHDAGHFLGKVVLFPEFGFSGIPRIIEMRCGDVEGMVKYPGTDYYVPKSAVPPVMQAANSLKDQVAIAAAAKVSNKGVSKGQLQARASLAQDMVNKLKAV